MSASTYIEAPGPEPGVPHAEVRPSVSFLDLVKSDLEAVENRMNDDLGSDVRTVYALTRHVLNAGGKRLRPAMVALAARAVNPKADVARIASVGAAVEFVHMATLVHDDVVDNTATRRGKPTANAVFGNGVAVLSGDYILARAMRLLAIDGDLRIIRTVSEITVEMSEGEVMEIAATNHLDLSMPVYLEILRKKTATFVEGCCRCGAILGGAGGVAEESLAAYGCGLGMAFQLADDLLDYFGEPAVTGKPRGSDLRDGRATLPLMVAMDRADAADRERLKAAFGNAALTDAGVLDVCRIIVRCGGDSAARDAARSEVERAEQALEPLPQSAARESLLALTSYVIQRDH